MSNYQHVRSQKPKQGCDSTDERRHFKGARFFCPSLFECKLGNFWRDGDRTRIVHCCRGFCLKYTSTLFFEPDIST